VESSSIDALDTFSPPTVVELLRFERLLSDAAARLLNVAPEEMDETIEASVSALGAYLGSEHGGIALFSEDRCSLVFRHGYFAPGVSPYLLGVDLAAALPWYGAALRAGRPVILPHLPLDLPPEAAEERELTVAVGIKSNITLPLKAGGVVLGALGWDFLAAHRSWSPDLISRLELLASVYANALHRRRALAQLQRVHDLNRTVLASVSSEIVVLDRDGRVVAVNEAWTRSARREAIPQERLCAGSDYVAAIERAVADGDVEVREVQEVQDALRGVQEVLSGARSAYETTYRFGRSGRLRHYLLTVAPSASGDGAVVLHTDVTPLEEAKAALERSLEEVRGLKDRLEAENIVLQQEVRQHLGFDEIVGRSPALNRVLAQVERVGPTDAAVLLLGETGTGKDLVARALHDRSPRRERPLVTVNCAAVPAALVESELFGYEKGAFTGAVQRTLGRFEVAHGGSLFLDEIGELPLDVQAKLLRVLQSGEFERLGSPRTVKVDVRVIAATNRDLQREVREGRFRADLFYRLSVFPIALPPLRERPEDIPLLVWHIIARKQAKLGRSIKRVPDRVMRAFLACAWPGNVRELENVVERALIMTSGTTLAADSVFLQAAPVKSSSVGPRASLAEAERAHILAVLEDCGWKVSGKGNAADRLGLRRSTLQYRMSKLGIARPGAPR
jgi:transcriptional regulator with PAS, ATPase and Fis domain